MKFQKCTIDDINILIEIATKTYREHYQYLWKDKGEHYIKTSYNPNAFAAELKNKNVCLYLIKEAEEVYGYLQLTLDAAYSHYSEQEALEMQRIYLLKKAIGKGIGSAILKEIDQLARQLNKKVVWLKVMDSSPAKNFYKKAGYKVCGETTLKSSWYL